MHIRYRRPFLYPKQLAAIYAPERYSIIEATTKAGKTFGCIVWLVEQAFLGKNGQNFWWVAPVSGQARIAFKRAIRHIRPKGLARVHLTEMTLTLPNGATMWFKSGDKPDGLYGDDVHAAVIDEASRFKTESWYAIRTTLTATRGRIRIIGNVKGRRNWFYQLARRAQKKELPDASYHKIVARDAIAARVITGDEVEDARKMLPEAVFRELYEAEPSDDQGNPFGFAAIRACLQTNEEASAIAGMEAHNFGWDLGKKRDWTVGIGIGDGGHVVNFERFQKPWPVTVSEIKRVTGYNAALVDSTGLGDPIVEYLQQEAGSNFEGYPFTPKSKQQLMEGLALAIQHRHVTLPPDPEHPIVLELETFEYEYTRNGVKYSAPEGFHDDCVCSLALAVACKSEHRSIDVWEKAFR